MKRTNEDQLEEHIQAHHDRDQKQGDFVPRHCSVDHYPKAEVDKASVDR